jgi:transcriptional regulator with XRE-family HTH domain
MSTIGQRLEAARVVRGLTPPQLAIKAGLSVSFVNMIERGERGKRLGGDTAVALAVALGCDVRWLLSGEGEAPEAPAGDAATRAA